MNKYEEIAYEINERIHKGIYKPGEVLPDQNTLAEEFNTSRITLRKAIQLLIVEGLLYCQRGSGTYVRKNVDMISKKYSKADDFLGTTRNANKGDKVTSKILRFDVRFPNEKESEALLIDSTEPVYDVIRVRYINNAPSSLEYSIMPTNIVKGLNEDILHASIYSYLQKDLGLKIEGAHRIIQADKASQVDIEELKVEMNDPILEVEQVAYLDNGTPFEMSNSRYPYNTAKIIADVIIGD